MQALPRQQSFSSTVPSEDVEPPTKEQLHRHTAKNGYKHVDGHAIMHEVLPVLHFFSQRVYGFVKSLNHQQKQHNFIHDDNSDLCFTGASKQRQCLSLGACVFHGVVYRSTPDICFITVKPKRRFGFLDNFLMIVFGDLIDSTLCVT